MFKLFDLITDVASILALFIAIWSVLKADKNHQKQIIVYKLEEVVSLMHELGRQFYVLKELTLFADNLKDKTDYPDLTLNDLYNFRDLRMSKDKQEKFESSIFRVMVLRKSYLKGDVSKKIEDYENLLYSMFYYGTTGGSLFGLINYENKYPTFEEFSLIQSEAEKLIIDLINYD